MAYSDYCSDSCGCEEPCAQARASAEPSEFDTRAERERAAAVARLSAVDVVERIQRALADTDGMAANDEQPGARILNPEALTDYLAPVSTDEDRVVDPTTGGVKGRKLARFDLLPADALHATAEHFGRGARKYADRNWEAGYAWGLSFGAMMRHAWAYWGGEDVDEETGSLHLAAVAFHSLALLSFQLRGIGTDDRHATQHGDWPRKSTPELDLGA